MAGTYRDIRHSASRRLRPGGHRLDAVLDCLADSVGRVREEEHGMHLGRALHRGNGLPEQMC